MTIHDRLRQLRQQRGLTQEQVAGQIGLTRQALSSYESGRTRPDVETLMVLAEIYGTDLESLLHGNEKQLKAAHQIKMAAGITFSLLCLLTLVSSAFLWCKNQFFPLDQGQISPEEMALLETHMRLDNAWTFTDSILLTVSVLAFLLLLLFLVKVPGAIPLKYKLLYAGTLAAGLLLLPLPFALTDPLFPPVNYLITPSLVVVRLGVFLVLDLAAESFVKKKRKN